MNKKKTTPGTRAKVPARSKAKASNPDKPTIAEMEKALGLHDAKPIALTPSDAEEARKEGDVYQKWYERDLRKSYTRKK